MIKKLKYESLIVCLLVKQTEKSLLHIKFNN